MSCVSSVNSGLGARFYQGGGTVTTLFAVATVLQ